MNITRSLSAILFGATLMCTASQAMAARPLVVYTDQSVIIDLPREPDIVVVGNPSIADASIQGQKIFIHGRSYGTTNLIVLDDKGAQIGNYEVDVQLGGHNNVSLIKAGQMFSYVCVTDCQVVMHVGDEPAWFKEQVLKRNEEKINIATGQKSPEASQPPPAQ